MIHSQAEVKDIFLNHSTKHWTSEMVNEVAEFAGTQPNFWLLVKAHRAHAPKYFLLYIFIYIKG